MKPRIFAMGVGGAGGNVINNIIRSALEGVEFVVANTDAQALENSLCPIRIRLGEHLTQGLGAGSQPDIGKAAAEETANELTEHLCDADMLFLTAGMGGGTGTGATEFIARLARELGILTVAFVTKPFNFEGNHRMRIAEEGIANLEKAVDTLLVVPNQNLFFRANERTTFVEAFAMVDHVLRDGIRSLVELITTAGLINHDFADIRVIMQNKGRAMMGTGEAEGERRAILAAESAIANPLLDNVSLRGASGVLINICGGHDLTLFEADEAAQRIKEEVDIDANIIVGTTFNESLGDVVRVSVVATGLSGSTPPDNIMPKKKNDGTENNNENSGGNNGGSMANRSNSDSKASFSEQGNLQKQEEFSNQKPKEGLKSVSSAVNVAANSNVHAIAEAKLSSVYRNVPADSQPNSSSKQNSEVNSGQKQFSNDAGFNQPRSMNPDFNDEILRETFPVEGENTASMQQQVGGANRASTQATASDKTSGFYNIFNILNRDNNNRPDNNQDNADVVISDDFNIPAHLRKKRS